MAAPAATAVAGGSAPQDAAEREAAGNARALALGARALESGRVVLCEEKRQSLQLTGDPRDSSWLRLSCARSACMRCDVLCARMYICVCARGCVCRALGM